MDNKQNNNQSQININCSFCGNENIIQLPLKHRINIDCNCGAWGYISEDCEKDFYGFDLNKKYGKYMAKLPTRVVNNGLYTDEYIDLNEYFSIASGDCNGVVFKWTKVKEKNM